MGRDEVAARPRGYWWMEAWPVPGRAGTVAMAAFFGLFALLAVWLAGPAGVVFFASFGVLAVVVRRRWGKPAVVVENYRAVLVFRPWSSPALQGPCVLTAASVALISGVPSRLPETAMRVMGVLLLIIVAPLAPMGLCARNRMIFGARALRVSRRNLLGRSDNEFPWDAITDLALVPAFGKVGQNPAVVFTCPRAAVTDRLRTGSRRTGTPADNRWKLVVGNWNVEPNALLATLRFMADHPDVRADVTAAQATAMLTPPWHRIAGDHRG